MELKPGEHIEVRCIKCEHRVRFHEKGQFSCIVEGCNCKEFEPKEVIVDDKMQNDILTLTKPDETGKRKVVDSMTNSEGRLVPRGTND